MVLLRLNAGETVAASPSVRFATTSLPTPCRLQLHATTRLRRGVVREFLVVVVVVLAHHGGQWFAAIRCLDIALMAQTTML